MNALEESAEGGANKILFDDTTSLHAPGLRRGGRASDDRRVQDIPRAIRGIEANRKSTITALRISA